MDKIYIIVERENGQQRQSISLEISDTELEFCNNKGELVLSVVQACKARLDRIGTSVGVTGCNRNQLR